MSRDPFDLHSDLILLVLMLTVRLLMDFLWFKDNSYCILLGNGVFFYGADDDGA